MKRFIVILALLLFVGGAYALIRTDKAHDVETVKPVSQAAVQAVYATGTVEAGVMVPIAPKVGARLMTLEVDEGAVVEKDQLLAQLEDTDIKSTLVDLEAKLALANSDLRRAQTLGKTGAISKSGLDQARAAQKSAQAAVDRAKAELGYLKLLAPEAGTIIKRDGEIGEMIPVNQAVFWMTGGDTLRIETEVDEEDISLVKIGQDVVISADAFPEQIFNGKVQSITPKGDPVARSYRVRVSLNQSTPLMIGMTAETNIITQKKDNALMVPASAVREKKLYVMKGHKPALAEVRTGITTPDMVEILEGVTPEDSIVKNYADASVDDKKETNCNMGTGC